MTTVVVAVRDAAAALAPARVAVVAGLPAKPAKALVTAPHLQAHLVVILVRRHATRIVPLAVGCIAVSRVQKDAMTHASVIVPPRPPVMHARSPVLTGAIMTASGHAMLRATNAARVLTAKNNEYEQQRQRTFISP